MKSNKNNFIAIAAASANKIDLTIILSIIIYGVYVDKLSMNFDQIGEQHVSRRRKPSPLKNTKYTPSAFDAEFSQKVWPRSSHAPKAGKSRKKEESAAKPERGSAGFTISPEWLKKIVIMGGVLVIAIVGPNWESISEWFTKQEISDVSLEDDGALRIKTGWADLPGSGEFISPAEAPVLSGFTLGNISINLLEPFSWTEHKILAGENTYKIAEKYSVSAESIIAFNNLREAWNIQVGKTLKIPNMDGIPYVVEKNDNLTKIADKMKVPLNAILDANNIPNANIQPGVVLFIPGARMDANEFKLAIKPETAKQETAEKPMIRPVPGAITSGYGWRLDPVNPQAGVKLFHKAVDFYGKIGDPVKSAMKGTVLHMDNNRTLGNFIVLKHDGYQTVYAHLSEFSVKTGEAVKQGQEIGKIGDTGYTTGAHLHFAAIRNGAAVNPLELLK